MLTSPNCAILEKSSYTTRQSTVVRHSNSASGRPRLQGDVRHALSEVFDGPKLTDPCHLKFETVFL